MDRGRFGISQEEEPEGEQPMDEVKPALLYSDERYVVVARSVFYVYSRPSLGHAPPYGADNDHKKSAAFTSAIICCSLQPLCYHLLFSATALVLALLSFATLRWAMAAANHRDLGVSSLLSTH